MKIRKVDSFPIGAEQHVCPPSRLHKDPQLYTQTNTQPFMTSQYRSTHIRLTYVITYDPPCTHMFRHYICGESFDCVMVSNKAGELYIGGRWPLWCINSQSRTCRWAIKSYVEFHINMRGMWRMMYYFRSCEIVRLKSGICVWKMDMNMDIIYVNW